MLLRILFYTILFFVVYKIIKWLIHHKNHNNINPPTGDKSVRKKRFADEDIQDAEFKDVK